MFGLGKKTEPTAALRAEDLGLRIHTIPKPFYGKVMNDTTAGSTVSNQAPKAVVVAPSPMPAQQAAAAVVVGKPSVVEHTPRHEAPTAAKKRTVLWVVLGLAVLVVIGGATWYYTRGFVPAAPVVPAVVPVVVETPPSDTIPLPAEELQPTPMAAATSTVEVLRPIIDIPDTIDDDRDGLTDTEEELYKSDVGAADTDNDGYNDGLEVVNLYDPMSTAPAPLASSTNVGVYDNSIAGYRIAYPVDWLAAAVNDSTKDEVLFTSLTGEFVSLKQYPLPPGETFVGWFTKYTQVFYSSLTAWTNRMKIPGWYESTRLRYYFARPDAVFVMEYHPGVRTSINFRTSMRMMAESFQYVVPTTVPVTLPEASASSTVPETPLVETPSVSVGVASSTPSSTSTEEETSPFTP